MRGGTRGRTRLERDWRKRFRKSQLNQAGNSGGSVALIHATAAGFVHFDAMCRKLSVGRPHVRAAVAPDAQCYHCWMLKQQK